MTIEQLEAPTEFAAQITNIALLSYSREIMPMIRAIEDKKQELKGYIDANEQFDTLRTNVTSAQEALAFEIEKDDTVREFSEAIKEATKELKQALKSAAKATDYKPAELKTFFSARAKDKAVEKVVTKAKLFIELEEQLA